MDHHQHPLPSTGPTADPVRTRRWTVAILLGVVALWGTGCGGKVLPDPVPLNEWTVPPAPPPTTPGPTPIPPPDESEEPEEAGEAGEAGVVPCDPVDLAEGADPLADHTRSIEVTVTDQPVQIDLLEFLDLPGDPARPCLRLIERDEAPEGTYLGEFELDGTTVTFTPPTRTEDSSAPWWGRTAARFCVDGLDLFLRGCNTIDVRVLPQEVLEIVEIAEIAEAVQAVESIRMAEDLLDPEVDDPVEVADADAEMADVDVDVEAGPMASLAALPLLDDTTRGIMRRAGTSPSGVATVQDAYYGIWSSRAMTFHLDALRRFIAAAGCAGVQGVVLASWETTLDALDLLVEGFGIAMVEIDAMRGIDPSDEFRQRTAALRASVDTSLTLIGDILDWSPDGLGVTTPRDVAVSVICDAVADQVLGSTTSGTGTDR